MRISKLPKEYRELAEKNRNVENHDNLYGAFHWGNSPEKYDFWFRCYIAKNVKELPPLPDNEE